MSANLNLHKVKFTMLARNRRVKSLFDLRKTRRSQVFLGHRFRHFISSDDRIRICFQTLWEHLNSITCYSEEQKFTTLLLVMIKQTPQITDFIRIDAAAEIMEHINDEHSVLVSSICYILNEIGINYLLENKKNIYIQFECDTLTFRPNLNSISNVMVELLARLLYTFSNRCQTEKIPFTKDILYIFELCYQRFGQYGDVIRQNLHTLLALTQGIGRFERTQTICNCESLMLRLMAQHMHDTDDALIVLKISNSICKGFPENIPFLLKCHLLDHLKVQLANTNGPRYEIVEESLSILENICGNHRSDIQAVIDHDLILPLINACVSPADNVANHNLQKIALNALYNISTLGSIEQIRVLLNLKLLDILCNHLSQINSHEEILEISLAMLNTILVDFYRKDHHAFHRVSNKIIERGSFLPIKRLTANYDNKSISRMANEIIKYSEGTCEKCYQMTTPEIFETMQQ
ncbi:uncharacterized protein LOC116343268 [Contarinia nasturtii]|uniref:uncharacterized protein LOC116343268 n=1 Tax=Contarinia nasturtii TaxID=265458 RepID=UPI0012D3752A|nr:uncharacterized protein LOC116343268 [Contarinia nasturtii]